MAHRTNVIQVLQALDGGKGSDEKVVDPVCGKEMTRRESRSVLFRGDETIHFCSRECQQEFLKPKKKAA